MLGSRRRFATRRTEVLTHQRGGAKDFRALVHQCEFQYIRIRTYQPESNGRIELARLCSMRRFHCGTREAISARIGST